MWAENPRSAGSFPGGIRGECGRANIHIAAMRAVRPHAAGAEAPTPGRERPRQCGLRPTAPAARSGCDRIGSRRAGRGASRSGPRGPQPTTGESIQVEEGSASCGQVSPRQRLPPTNDRQPRWTSRRAISRAWNASPWQRHVAERRCCERWRWAATRCHIPMQAVTEFQIAWMLYRLKHLLLFCNFADSPS